MLPSFGRQESAAIDGDFEATDIEHAKYEARLLLTGISGE
jgi:hypothetical protein